MTIDFTKLNVETRIDCFDVLDLHEVVGEAAFAGAPSLAVDELSRRIFKSNGPVEMTEQEYNGLLGAVNGQLAFRVIQAIRRQAESTDGKEAQP
jgi:hypothetical protein